MFSSRDMDLRSNDTVQPFSLLVCCVENNSGPTAVLLRIKRKEKRKIE
jgi:hypothetical protein